MGGWGVYSRRSDGVGMLLVDKRPRQSPGPRVHILQGGGKTNTTLGLTATRASWNTKQFERQEEKTKGYNIESGSGIRLLDWFKV